MKTISRYIMTLALLITAASGAWAGGLEGRTFVDFKIEFRTNPYSVIAPASGYLPDGVSVTGTTYNGSDHGVFGGTITVPVDGPVKFTIGACYYSKADIVVKKDGELFTTVNNNATCGETTGNYSQYITYKYNGEAAMLTFELASNVFIPYFFAEALEPGIEVTINDTETEASFDMPAYDVAVDYELVRDITQKVDVEVRIDGAATERIRIAKDGDGHYKFVTKQENGWQFAAVDKLDNNKDLTNGELTYTLKMKVDDEYVAKNFDTELCPGTWRLEATANAEKPYEGTAYGKDIELYTGYEVTVPAGEYATLFVKEAVVVDEGSTDAELYTIANVTESEAQLSDAIKVAPKETPLLVYNKNEESKTFLLIPTAATADEVSVAKEFKGTLVEMEMPASSTRVDYYVCTGSAFMWVRDAGVIAANRCWLQIGEQPAASRAKTRSIVGGGDTTSLRGVNSEVVNSEDYYDLQGRKVAKPTRGGIYIHNGKKVIVR